MVPFCAICYMNLRASLVAEMFLKVLDRDKNMIAC